jgi:hypothetical protein
MRTIFMVAIWTVALAVSAASVMNVRRYAETRRGLSFLDDVKRGTISGSLECDDSTGSVVLRRPASGGHAGPRAMLAILLNGPISTAALRMWTTAIATAKSEGTPIVCIAVLGSGDLPRELRSSLLATNVDYRIARVRNEEAFRLGTGVDVLPTMVVYGRASGGCAVVGIPSREGLESCMAEFSHSGTRVATSAFFERNRAEVPTSAGPPR